MDKRLGLTCETCRKDFSLPLCRVRQGYGRFCSKTCGDEWRASRKKERERACEVCGTVFHPRWGQISRGHGRFCSHKCLGIAHTGDRNPTFGVERKPEQIEKWRATVLARGGYPAGDRHPNWKGGKTTAMGYVVIGDSKNRAMEHRAIMELHLGRPLTDQEIVHHINGDKKDNRIENLQVMTRAAHIKEHLPGMRLAAVRRYAKDLGLASDVVPSQAAGSPD